VSESPFFYLTLDQVEELHDLAVEGFGGRPGVLNPDNLQLACQAPYDVWQQERGDLWEQAAAYACTIIQHPPYHDGNKRTALACTLVFLEVNGYDQHDFHEGTLFEAISWLARNELDRRNFAQYLRDAYHGASGIWAEDTGPGG